jgi:hypothetical protein
MTEGVVDDFQVIEIDYQQRPTVSRRPLELGKRGIIGGPVRVTGQCVGKRTPLMFEDTLMSVYGYLILTTLPSSLCSSPWIGVEVGRRLARGNSL